MRVPPPPTAVRPGPTVASDRLLDSRALGLVAMAIGVGALMQVIALVIGHDHSLEPATLIRWSIVLTLGTYAVVGVLVVRKLTPSVRLRWGDGPVALRIGIGVLVGAGIGGLILAAVSAASGHLEPDPRIVLLMSEGDPTHILVTVFLTCVAAPLVEETLFRGLLLESLRPRGRGIAILVSALAFAAWHLMPESLIYYTALGAVLGGLYLSRGLAGSMAAHVGFNTVLTIAAISVVLGPSHDVQVGALRLTAPSGWSVPADPTDLPAGATALLVGPSASEVAIVPGMPDNGLTATEMAARLRLGTFVLPDFELDGDTVRAVPTPAGVAVEVDIKIEGRSGTVALIDGNGQLYEVMFLSAGSTRATEGFDQMVQSAHIV